MQFFYELEKKKHNTETVWDRTSHRTGAGMGWE